MPRSTSTSMHTHFGVLVIGGTFLGVLLAGTLWRLIAAHLAVSPNPMAQAFAKTMAVQY